jgi:predicted nucleic-acid-binding Zn-ribbon protein
MGAFFSKRENVTDRLLTCPRCGNRDFMENIEDSEISAPGERGDGEGKGD